MVLKFQIQTAFSKVLDFRKVQICTISDDKIQLTLLQTFQAYDQRQSRKTSIATMHEC